MIKSPVTAAGPVKPKDPRAPMQTASFEWPVLRGSNLYPKWSL
jgi:hypothetical protein